MIPVILRYEFHKNKDKQEGNLSGLKTLHQAEFLSELVHTLKLQVPRELVPSGCTYIHTNQYKKSHLEYETLKLL